MIALVPLNQFSGAANVSNGYLRRKLNELINAVNGLSSSSNVRVATITFDGGGVQNIGDVLPANARVLGTWVSVVVELDDVAATVAIGVVGDTDQLMPSGELEPSALGIKVSDNFDDLGGEQLIASVSPGTSTQGTIEVVVSYVLTA